MCISGENQPPHVLVFPYPAQGHLLPLLDLTHQLSLRDIAVTIVTTPKNYPTLTPLLSTHPAIDALVLPFPSHPLIPPGVENVKDLGSGGNFAVMSTLTKLYEPLLEWFRSQHNPPVAIISDFFLGWTTRLARELGIPRFAFYSSGAFLAAVSDYCWRNVDSVKGLEVVNFAGLPGSPSFKEAQLPSVFKGYKKSDPDWENIREDMLANMDSYGVIFNTFEALESEYISYLKRKVGHERILSVGPLSLLSPDSSARGNPEGCCAHVFRWLDNCPDGSVLYVCFGSQKLLNKEQMAALANALEKSMTRFVWVVKPGTTRQAEEGYGSVPEGFEERVAGRGMVIKGWAPQVVLISHKAVGGFLSHCGWNSTLEGIVGGKMILAWPMEADQYVNARLLVEDMGAAVLACEGANTVPDSDRLAGVIAESIGERAQEKERAKELRSKALDAVKNGGSSSMELEEFVTELCKSSQADETHKILVAN